MSTLPKLALAVVSVLLTLLAVEAFGRFWVWLRWPEAKLHEHTHVTATRGRFTTHPELGYALTPGFRVEGFSHNARGLRGPEIGERRPGVARVAIVGASTVYGIYVTDEETSASALQRQLAEDGIAAEVINGGVPGWTSHETARSWSERIAPLEPDVGIVMDGRNDAFPQLWLDFREDYAHFRDPTYQVVTSNLAFKRLFQWSRMAMLVISRGELFGFSRVREHPIYGAIRWENQPSVEQAYAGGGFEAKGHTFERNLRALVATMRAGGTRPVLATVPYWEEGYGSGWLGGREYAAAVGARVRENNERVRRLARELSLPLVEAEDLSGLGDEILHDDCHFRPEGEERVAARMRAVVAPLLTASHDGT